MHLNALLLLLLEMPSAHEGRRHWTGLGPALSTESVQRLCMGGSTCYVSMHHSSEHAAKLGCALPAGLPAPTRAGQPIVWAAAIGLAAWQL